MYDSYVYWKIEEELYSDPHAWRDYAECLDATEEEEPLLFPWERPEPTDEQVAGYIKSHCGECLVQTQCLRFAAKTQSIGTWGGKNLSSRDSARLNRLHSRKPAFTLEEAEEALNPGEEENA